MAGTRHTWRYNQLPVGHGDTDDPVPWRRRKSHPCCSRPSRTNIIANGRKSSSDGSGESQSALHVRAFTCCTYHRGLVLEEGPHSGASIIFRVHPRNHSEPIGAGAPPIPRPRRPHRACLHPGCLTVSSTAGLPASMSTAVQKTG